MRFVRMRLLTGGLLLCLGAVDAQAQTVELRSPRSFGYLVGDVVRLEAVVTADPRAQLNPASLPHPRGLTPWLDLRSVSVEHATEDGANRYRLLLDYQLLDAPLEPTARTIPPVTVKFEKAGQISDAVIPAWTLLMAPLRGAIRNAPLMPDARPQLPQSSVSPAWIAAEILGALASLILLAWHYAWWPFTQRKARPFTSAWRQIRHLDTDRSYADSLIALHRAFDAAAGRRVFASDLPHFLDDHPQFRMAQDEIRAFFEASRVAFFVSDLAAATQQQPFQTVSALSRRLSQLERRAA